jgi:D-alanine-D-alanine ligase
VETLGLPLIVKPPSGGSTLGLTLAHDRQEVERGMDLALEYEERILFETYVRGREITVGILGREALPVGEIIPEHEIFDYECKYRPGMAREIFPADLSPEAASLAQQAALRVHDTLLLRDFSRVDFILDGEGTPWCLEANALPGMTGNSLVPQAARAAGISFPEFCGRVAEMGRMREW